MVALRPHTGRSQAMIRDEPALHVYDANNPAAPVNGRISAEDDLTVRQPPSASVIGAGLPASTVQGGDPGVVDLTGARGAALLMNRVGWRPIFYLNLGTAYNDNIYISSHKEGDLISTVEPGVILAVGDFQDALPRMTGFEHVFRNPLDPTIPQTFAFLDYHPSIYLFAKHGSQDAVDESVNALGSYNFPKLLLGIHAQYQKLSIEDVDAGFRIDRDFYTLDLTSNYQYSDKTSGEFNFSVRDREYEAPYISSTELVSQNYLDYAYGPKTTFSAGFAAGYIDYRGTLNQTYQQGLVRINSIQFAKLDFIANGGVEFRQNLGGKGSKVGVIFDASVNFHPYESTTISLLASRDTEPSALVDQDVTYTRVSLAWQQRVRSRFFLTVRGTYANADYSAVQTGQSLDRNDDSEEFFISAATDITPYASLQASYQFRNTTSTTAGRTYTENVAGVAVRFTY